MGATRQAIVLTAIEPETKAMVCRLENLKSISVNDTWFQTGTFGRWSVAIAEVGAGNTRAATVAVRGMEHFKPEIAAFVGVAGGIKDVELGDVIVATKIYGYESGKETPEGFLARPDVQTSSHGLEQRARVLRGNADWQRFLTAGLWASRKPRIHIGPLAAGEVVVADNQGRIAHFLKRTYSDAFGVEMEGRGFLEAAHIFPKVSTVVIRGVSDLLSGKDETDKLNWQERAADAASAVFFSMLALDCDPTDLLLSHSDPVAHLPPRRRSPKAARVLRELAKLSPAQGQPVSLWIVRERLPDVRPQLLGILAELERDGLVTIDRLGIRCTALTPTSLAKSRGARRNRAED